MAKLVLVEDNEDNRDILTRRLEKRGFEIRVALSGEEAIEMANNEQPDLILMDVRLPVMDGFEAARRLKSAERTRKIPVIALTAHAMSGDRERALQAGFDDYDTKPVELHRLLAKIHSLLALHSGGRA